MNKDIKEAILNGNLIIFLGAGASANAKNGRNEILPLGYGLGILLAKDLEMEFNPDETNLQSVYETYHNLKGTEILKNRLFQIFGNCTPTQDYINLAKLPIYRIYTLNIDDSLESTLRRYSKNSFEVFSRNGFITDISITDPILSLIKLNGDINKSELGFIFSASEYAKESNLANKWYQELARDFNRYTFLFIGTQLNEPLLKFHLEQYKKSHDQDIINPKSFLLTPKISDFEKINLERSNIYHIKGTMETFDQWIEEHLNEMPTYRDIIKSKRPYMAVVSSSNIDDINEIVAISHSITDLQEVISTIDKSNDIETHNFNKFYQGFKPEWVDILSNIPSKLTKINNFYRYNFIEKTPIKNSLYLIYGAAGSGKTTSIMQISYMLKRNTSNNVYFVDRNYESLTKIVSLLDRSNNKPYYILIDKIIQGYDELAEILKSGKSNAIFIISEDIKIWEYRAKEYLGPYLTKSIDISFIEKKDVALILEKIEKYGIWTRLSRMSKAEREEMLFKNSKSQLLIGLLETTLSEGYEKIIYNDFHSIKGGNEKALLLLASIAAVQNLPSDERTLLRALNYLGYSNQSIHYIVSRKLAGILSYKDGKVTTRHRLYSDKLFGFVENKAELQNIVIAYINAFANYDFPIVTTVKSKSEANLFKHLVNFKFLNKLLSNDKILVLDIYRKFEKKFEQEGLFLMQYGLALRSYGMHYEALDMLSTALEAFPQSNHIEHALAHQKIIIATEYPFGIKSQALLNEAVIVLTRLSKTDMKGNHDRYPIVTLSKGHINYLLKHDDVVEAKSKASEYYSLISNIPNWQSDKKLKIASSVLMKFATNNSNSISWSE